MKIIKKGNTVWVRHWFKWWFYSDLAPVDTTIRRFKGSTIKLIKDK